MHLFTLNISLYNQDRVKTRSGMWRRIWAKVRWEIISPSLSGFVALRTLLHSRYLIQLLIACLILLPSLINAKVKFDGNINLVLDFLPEALCSM